MAKGFITGGRLSFDDTTDEIIQVEDGIKFLNPADNGIKFVKQLIANRGDKVAKQYTYNWDETDLPVRRETVTMLIGDTTMTVANSKAYHVGDIIKCESEVMRVTALTNATTLTITRGYAGTAAAAHTAKLAFNLGYSAIENSTGPAAITSTGVRLFNYVEQFEDAVEISDIEQGTLSTDANPMNRQLERITLSFWKRFANALVKGVRYNDTTNKLRLMGGIDQFLATNVTNVGGALTQAALDALILNQVVAGGNPTTIVLSPQQKQKLDALDNNKQLLTKQEHVGGGLITNVWQSGVLDHPLDVVIDHTCDTTELYVLDSSTMAVIPFVNNGVDGRLSIVDATLPGQAGQKKVLRAYYTFEMIMEAANGKLTGLS